MDNEVTEKLTLLGLSETESKLYQTGLGLGKSTSVQQLQTLTGLKRPTIYHALDTLAVKGLVAKTASLNKQFFSFTPPAQLERNVEKDVLKAQSKLRLAVELTPLLESIIVDANNTVVSHYENVEGIKAVVDIALYCKDPNWRIIAPKVNFFSEFDTKFARYYLNSRKRHKIISKSLWERPTLPKSNKSLDVQQQYERDPRYLPESMTGHFSSTLILFDDKVAIFSSAKSHSAILITSQEVHDMFSSMFDGLWEVSTPYNNL